MAIVRNPKVNGVYFAYDNHLKVGSRSSTNGHQVIVTSINKKSKTANVKTITSLEDYDRRNHRWVFRQNKLNDVKKGNILVIPMNQIKTNHLSGVHHNTRKIKLNQLHYKNRKSRTKYPKRYSKLIHRK